MNVENKNELKAILATAIVAGSALTSTARADWDSGPIVAEITKAGPLILAIGAAILGIVALTFAYRMMKGLLGR